VAAFLAGRNHLTFKAYRADLEDFSTFTGATSPEAATGVLLSRGQGGANEPGLAYKASLIDRGLAAATVNRRLAALRSLVKLARLLGLVSWSLDVEGARAEAYRDTRGPGRVGFLCLLDELATRLDAKARRDRAAVRLLYDLGLRRAEVVSLDLEHLNLETGKLQVLGKGRTSRVPLTLPPQTLAVLAAWLEVRGPAPGPIFVNFDRAGKGKRLTGTSLYRIVRALGKAAGVTARPHGLRHAAITEALEVTGGNVEAAQQFARHRDPRITIRYNDNRKDLAGEVARLVAARGTRL
jgi:integrase/recombinase XerC